MWNVQNAYLHGACSFTMKEIHGYKMRTHAPNPYTSISRLEIQISFKKPSKNINADSLPSYKISGSFGIFYRS